LPGITPGRPSPVKKNSGKQRADPKDNQKCPERPILLKPQLHGFNHE
jgi:hypothetical protein